GLVEGEAVALSAVGVEAERREALAARPGEGGLAGLHLQGRPPHRHRLRLRERGHLVEREDAGRLRPCARGGQQRRQSDREGLLHHATLEETASPLERGPAAAGSLTTLPSRSSTVRRP